MAVVAVAVYDCHSGLYKLVSRSLRGVKHRLSLHTDCRLRSAGTVLGV